MYHRYAKHLGRYTTRKTSEMANNADLHLPHAQQSILNLMLAPVKYYSSIFTILALPNYMPLLYTQSYATRRAVAAMVIQSLLKNRTKIIIPEHAEGMCSLIGVLIREGSQQPTYSSTQTPRRGGREMETDETMEEQGWLARVVHLLDSNSNDTQFKVNLYFSLIEVFHTNSLSFCKQRREPLLKGASVYALPPLP